MIGFLVLRLPRRLWPLPACSGPVGGQGPAGALALHSRRRKRTSATVLIAAA